MLTTVHRASTMMLGVYKQRNMPLVQRKHFHSPSTVREHIQDLCRSTRRNLSWPEPTYDNFMSCCLLFSALSTAYLFKLFKEEYASPDFVPAHLQEINSYENSPFAWIEKKLGKTPDPQFREKAELKWEAEAEAQRQLEESKRTNDPNHNLNPNVSTITFTNQMEQSTRKSWWTSLPSWLFCQKTENTNTTVSVK